VQYQEKKITTGTMPKPVGNSGTGSMLSAAATGDETVKSAAFLFSAALLRIEISRDGVWLKVVLLPPTPRGRAYL
jgi:hypothetical protein